MNGIYPDYTGPTLETKLASLYPDWLYVDLDGGVIQPPIPEVPIGGGIPLKHPHFIHEPEERKPRRDEVLWLTPH